MSERQSREFIKAMDGLRMSNPGPMAILSEFFPIQKDVDALGRTVLEYCSESGTPVVYIDSIMPHLFFENLTSAYYSVAISYRSNSDAIKALGEIHDLAFRETSAERSEHMLKMVSETSVSSMGRPLVVVSGAMHIDYISGKLGADQGMTSLNYDPDVESLLKDAKRSLARLNPSPQDEALLKSLRTIFDNEISAVGEEINDGYMGRISSLSESASLKLSNICEYFVRSLMSAIDPFV